MSEPEEYCNKKPLLRKGYYENCPGCKVEQLRETQQGLSLKALGFIWISVLAAALPISSLFPFLYFMIRDLGIAKRDEDIGFYAGFMGCSFMIGRALTAVGWGVLADRYGRKPVIIIGILSVVVMNVLFGLSVNFWMAVITRFLLGAMNGLFSSIKAYACEVFPEERHALALSLITAAWGSGLIIGPALGGFLAQPVEKYPSLFPKESIFGRFPYFLPCLAISLVALPVLIASFWLPESLHMHDKYEESSKAQKICSSEETKSSALVLFKNWPLMSSIIVYCIYALHDMAYSEIFSLWVVSPRKNGGLSYSSQDVGEVLAISGVGLLVFQLTIYPFFEKLMGVIWTARLCGVLAIILLQCYPFMTYLSGLTLFLVLNCASLIKNVLANSITTGTFILQNRAVDQKQRGAANGLAMTGMSMCKAAGPAAFGAIFSWAQTSQHASFLPGDHMVFFLLNVIQGIGLLMTFKPFLAEVSERIELI